MLESLDGETHVIEATAEPDAVFPGTEPEWSESRRDELAKQLGIAHGELTGLSVQEAFLLGYELRDFYSRIHRSYEFRVTINASNRTRVEDCLMARQREFKWHWFRDSKQQYWGQLHVMPQK